MPFDSASVILRGLGFIEVDRNGTGIHDQTMAFHDLLERNTNTFVGSLQ